MANSVTKVVVQVIEIPTSLVLIGKSYQISLQIQNISPIIGNIKISYDGTGIQIKSSELINKEVQLPPNSSKMDHVEIIPIQKGIVSLNLKIIHLEEVIKEVERIIYDLPSPDLPTIESKTIDTSIEPTSQSPPVDSSIFKEHFSSDISDALEDIFAESGEITKPDLPPSTPSPPAPRKIIEKVKEIIEEEIYSTSIYLNALDKESSAALKQFAKKGDSNILASQMGLPLCVCYFYSENQPKKWKIRPALIRNLCIRMKERFSKFSYYLSYPLSKEFDKEEIPIIQEAMQTFILPQSSSSNPLLILNLDIIPELEKPSIIIGYEQLGIYESVKNLLTDIFGKSIDILVDDCIFSGGLFYNHLVNWMGESQARVLNIVLSNNFITNIDMFQNLLESLASFSLGEKTK